MTLRALVTGGAGFIGSHVAELYLREGYAVEIIDDLSTGKRANIPTGAVFHELDIGSPEAGALVRAGRFDVVSHLAAQIDVRKSVTDPSQDARINIAGSLNLLEAVRAGGAKSRFIFSSTGGAIYGDFVSVPTVEDMAKDPESPYGIAKLSVEYYMGYFARTHGLDTVALRYANVYGPRQDPHGEAGVVAIFCNRILHGQAMTVFGDGLQTRDYVFVEDVARANLAAARATLPKMAQVDTRSFNIGTATETTVLQLADGLRRAAGADTAIQHAPPRAGEQLRSAVQIEKAKRLLGWSPTVGLDQGLAATFAFFEQRYRASAS
jgi:UDP-glucose 4-epimerase